MYQVQNLISKLNFHLFHLECLRIQMITYERYVYDLLAPFSYNQLRANSTIPKLNKIENLIPPLLDHFADKKLRLNKFFLNL